MMVVPHTLLFDLMHDLIWLSLCKIPIFLSLFPYIEGGVQRGCLNRFLAKNFVQKLKQISFYL